MRLLTPGKPEKATDKDRHARPVLQQPHLNVAEKAVYAATPFLAVRIPVEIEDGDTDGTLTAEALAAARKAKTDRIVTTEQSLLVHAREATLTFTRPENGAFPNVEQVLPGGKDYDHGFTIAFDPKQLIAIAEAMGAANVRLTFRKSDPAKYAIRVTPVNFVGTVPDPRVSDRVVGALMPIRIP